ncbi:inactive protein RESTRICTED TEV MOVEMENT 2 [Phoenix dactylifera]|uniref:Inactive protein RESTRICTED TEV MOVEMENT 2 n=1 Tax=Phoenix dactylifera TaxID=42345 RepID=A0A8B7C1D8_PHODC|nr:inactive protein RESTRICTED TEV MOVEMENT 2 [Phoenix dactylifera]
MEIGGRRVYKDFAPSYKWVREEGTDTLVIDLPEFNKEQVRVELDYSGKLSVSGERPLGDKRWSRFDNVFQVPKESNEFQARFENGHLHVKILPKTSEPKQLLVNVIVAVVVLIVMVLSVTSKN